MHGISSHLLRLGEGGKETIATRAQIRIMQKDLGSAPTSFPNGSQVVGDVKDF